MHMRHATVLALLALAASLAGCAEELSEANFTLTPTKSGWLVNEEASFLLKFEPEGAASSRYDLDPTFAVTEMRFEKDGLNAMGDFETKRAADLGLYLADAAGNSLGNVTLGAEARSVYLRFKVPEQLDNDVYRLEILLFKVGWVESETFRVAYP